MAQVRERLGRQILGTSVAGAPQRIDPLDRLLMLRHMRSKALVAVKTHERLFGGKVHLGKIDELVEGGGERQLIGPGAELGGEAVEQIQLKRVLPIDLRLADRDTGLALRFRCRQA